jgi:hypothetical protein
VRYELGNCLLVERGMGLVDFVYRVWRALSTRCKGNGMGS